MPGGAVSAGVSGSLEASTAGEAGNPIRMRTLATGATTPAWYLGV